MMLLALVLAAAPVPAHAAASHLPPRAMRGVVTTASGLRIRTLKAGKGPAPGPWDNVVIDYVGRLADGRVFDRANGASMTVSGTVAGFAEALQRMRKGGTYRIWIPPQLAYGDRGAGEGVVPPGATLDFTVALRDIAVPAETAASPPPHR
jgi:FKBP-type peptidyl-prolyl cis-trans isomerase